MKHFLSLNPLLPIVASFICGITIGFAIQSMLIPIISTALALILWFRHLNYATIISISFTLGAANMLLHLPAHVNDQKSTYRAIAMNCRESESSQIVIAKLISSGTDTSKMHKFPSTEVELIIPTFTPPVQLSDIITFEASFEEINPIRDVPDEITFEDYLLKQGIKYKTILKPEEIISIGKAPGVLNGLRRMRTDISRLIFRSSLSNESKEFLNTIVTGDVSTLTSETRHSFTNAGIAHILALSGLHVGVISLIISIALWPLNIIGLRKYGILITIIILWAYAAITGLSPSVVRAVIMATLFLASGMMQRRYSSFNTLAFAALLILLFNPMALFSIGFILSFSAVAGILMFGKHLNPISPRHKIPYYIISLPAISISAMLTASAVSAFYFHNFPLYFLIANITISPLLPLCLGIGLVTIIGQLMGFDCAIMCQCFDFIHSVISHIADFVANLPHANIQGLYFPAWLLIPYACAIILLKAGFSKRRSSYMLASAMLVAFALTAGFMCKPTFHNDELFVMRRTYHTDICIKSDSNLYLITTAPHQEYETVRSIADYRMRKYMDRRGIDTLSIIKGCFDSRHFSLRNNILGYRNHTIAVVSSDDLSDSKLQKINYAIVCRGYSKSIAEICSALRPDTILLGYDLHPRRHKRYVDECIDMGVAYKSLREATFHLSANSR